MGVHSKQASRADEETEALAAELLGYLRQHPDAGETLEGIVHWWLVRQRYLNAANKVQASLLLLEERGYIERIRNPDGIELFMAVSSALQGTNEKNGDRDPG